MPMPPSKSITARVLAILAALFAATFTVSLGICGYSSHSQQANASALDLLSIAGMVVSAVAFLVIGLVLLVVVIINASRQ